MGEVQCGNCGERVDYLVSNGICQKCFDEEKDD